MSLEVIVSQTLGTALGDESHLVLGEYSFFVSLFGKYPFISYGYHADWFIDKLPRSHLVELF